MVQSVKKSPTKQIQDMSSEDMHHLIGWVAWGQITIIPKPELRGLWEDSLTKPPFGVTSAEVATICPGYMGEITDSIPLFYIFLLNSPGDPKLEKSFGIPGGLQETAMSASFCPMRHDLIVPLLIGLRRHRTLIRLEKKPQESAKNIENKTFETTT